MPRLSTQIYLEIVSSIFAATVGAAILLGVYLLFRYNGVPINPDYKWKVLASFGLYGLWFAYRLWKKYKAKRG